MTQGPWGQVNGGQALPSGRCQHQRASRQEPREPPQSAAGGAQARFCPQETCTQPHQGQAKTCELLPFTDGAITA